jgi:hypothetical protein
VLGLEHPPGLGIGERQGGPAGVEEVAGQRIRRLVRVDLAEARHQIGGVAGRRSFLVEHDQAATVGAAEGAVTVEDVLAHLELERFGGIPAELQRQILGSEAVDVVARAELVDDAVPVAAAVVQTAGELALDDGARDRAV